MTMSRRNVCDNAKEMCVALPIRNVCDNAN